MSVRSKIYLTAMALLILSVFFVDEVEGRRKILRGRKTINRTYYKQLAIPAWAVVVCVGCSMILISGGIYILLDKYYLGDLNDAKLRARYSDP